MTVPGADQDAAVPRGRHRELGGGADGRRPQERDHPVRRDRPVGAQLGLGPLRTVAVDDPDDGTAGGRPVTGDEGRARGVAERTGARGRRGQLRDALAVDTVGVGAQHAATGALQDVDPAALAAVDGGVAPHPLVGPDLLQHGVTPAGPLLEAAHVGRVDQEEPAVLPHLHQELGMGGGAEVGRGQGDGAARAEVLVVGVEGGRVAGREELGRGQRTGGTHRQADEGFRKRRRWVVRRGGLGGHAVAGGQDDVVRTEGDEAAAALPDAGFRVLVGADARLVAPHGGDGVGAGADPDHDAPVGGDVAVGGERRVHGAVEEEQPGTLLRVLVVERHGGRVDRSARDLHREPGCLGARGGVDRLQVPVGTRQALAGLDPGGEVHDTGGGILDRRGGRADVRREVRAADRLGQERLAEGPLPDDGAGGGVDAVGHGLLGGHDRGARHHERLGVDGPGQPGREDLAERPRLDRGGTERRFRRVPIRPEVGVGGRGHVRRPAGQCVDDRHGGPRQDDEARNAHSNQSSTPHTMPPCRPHPRLTRPSAREQRGATRVGPA